MDTFASVELEGGDISASQEHHLRCSRFLNDYRHQLRCSSSAGYAGLLPPYHDVAGAALRHLPHVVFLSLPCTHSQTPTGGLRLGSHTPVKRTPSLVDPSHAVAGDDPHGGREDLRSPGGGNESRASKKRSRGTQVTPTESPTESPPKDGGNLGFGFGGEPSSPDQEPKILSNTPQTAPSDVTGRGEPKEHNHEPSETLNLGNQNAAAPKMVLGTRKLPASITNPPTEEGTSCRSRARERSPENPIATVPADDQLPMTLLDVVNMISGKPNRRFANIDILEILKMKGIEFPPPWWSQPGGS